MATKFGYSLESNPFNDPNLHDSFTWKKKVETGAGAQTSTNKKEHREKLVAEIEKVRRRRTEREQELEELDRLKEEESRLREMAGYDEWQRKEDEFHVKQQRQRSAIRLVEGREKPIDALAKNILMFGVAKAGGGVKYAERNDALADLQYLEAELTSPPDFLRGLKLVELQELHRDVVDFRQVEQEAKGGGGSSSNAGDRVANYWPALEVLCLEEIAWLKGGGKGGAHEAVTDDIAKLFTGLHDKEALHKMEEEILGKADEKASDDYEYWKAVLTQLRVHLAKEELNEIHCDMLKQQLVRLEERQKELKAQGSLLPEKKGGGADKAAEHAAGGGNDDDDDDDDDKEGDAEEDLGLKDEVAITGNYKWSDKYRPRKPRYFNRVKTGWDWNTYNKTHYDHDNPPPKIVQGYKFNVFYPDLIDKTTTPKFFLEPADSPDFCILRFHAGPPYEDVAFKIINKQWGRNRKRGFKSTFDRGVLTLYFNFESHWYRR